MGSNNRLHKQKTVFDYVSGDGARAAEENLFANCNLIWNIGVYHESYDILMVLFIFSTPDSFDVFFSSSL